jgi:hypothetical protein
MEAPVPNRLLAALAALSLFLPGCASGASGSAQVAELVDHLKPRLDLATPGCPRLVWQEQITAGEGLRVTVYGTLDDPRNPQCVELPAPTPTKP